YAGSSFILTNLEFRSKLTIADLYPTNDASISPSWRSVSIRKEPLSSVRVLASLIRIVTPSIIRPSPAERTSPITTTSAAPPPLWWVWDCAWVALMKPKFNKIKIVDSRNRVEEDDV